MSSDIDINFGTNAAEVITDIDRGAAATTRAEAAAARFLKTISAQTTASKSAAGGLRELTAATDKYINSATGAIDVERKAADQRLKSLQGEAGTAAKRRQLLLSIAKQGLADVDLLAKNGGDGGAGVFRHLARAAGSAGKAIGRELGIGGGVGAAVLGITALVKWGEVYNEILQHNKVMVEAVANAHLTLAHAQQSAREAGQGMGKSAADQYGGAITELVSQGGKGLSVAQGLSDRGQGGESFAATLAAKRKFGDRFESALAIAERSANAGGGGLGEGISNLSAGELGNPALAAARIRAQHLGKAQFSEQQLKDAEANIAANPLTQGISRDAVIKGQIVNANIAHIPEAVQGRFADLQNAKDPLARIMSDINTQTGEQIAILREIRDSQSWFARIWDKEFSGRSSAVSKYNDAVSVNGAAQ